MGTGDSFPRGKLPGCEADHSPPSSTEIKNAWSYTSTSPEVFSPHIQWWQCITGWVCAGLKSELISKYTCFFKSNLCCPIWAGIAQWYSGELRAGWWGFESRQGLGIFLFSTASRMVLGPIQPPIQKVPGNFSLGTKRPGREAGHSPPSNAEVKNVWSYISTPPYALMVWCEVKRKSTGAT
jgi:hypothetical protein